MTYQLDIDDNIGAWGISKSYVRQSLAGFKDKPVNVRISSLGGDVAHGLDIRQQFIDHGQVTAYLYGCVASSATIIALGAKKVCMSKYGMFLVHKVSNWVDEWGTYNADQIQEIIEKLKQAKEDNDKFDLVLASIYADKCKKRIEDILDVLKAGKWMTAQEALDYGFVDEIVEDADDQKMNFAGLANKISRFGYPALPACPVNESKESLLHAIFNKVQEIFDEMGRNKSNKANNQDNQIQMNMTDKKDFAQVNKILGCESLAFDDKGTLLAEEQVKKIDDAHKALSEDNDRLQKENEALKEQVKNLQQAPGASTENVNNVKAEQMDVFAEAKAMYNAI
jgi:ATP-dependent protease ClpP protease subunit